MSDEVVSRHQDPSRFCKCMVIHRPAPLELHRHHIHPLGMGGPDHWSNEVDVCPTTHANIHEIIRHMVKAGRMLSYNECNLLYVVPLSSYAWTLAAQGYNLSRKENDDA